MVDEQNPDDPQQKQKVQSPGSKEQASAYSNKNNLGEITSQNKIGDDTGTGKDTSINVIPTTSTITATNKEGPSLMGEQQSDTMTTPKTFPDTNRVRANELYKETGHVAKPSDEQDDEGDPSGQQASQDEDYKREQYKVSAERISDQARQKADERGGTPMEKEEARQKEEQEGIQAEQQRLQAEQQKKERYQDYAKMIGMGAVNGGMGIGAGLVQGADKGLGTLTSMTKQLMSGRPTGVGTAVGDAIVSGGLALKPVEDSIATSLGVNERNGTLDPEAVGTVKGLEYYQSKRRIGAFNQNMNNWLEQSLGEGVNKDNLLDALDRLDADGRAEFADKFTLMIDKEKNRIKAKEYAGQKLDAVDRAVLDSYSDVAGKLRQVATWRGREEHNEATAASYQATSIRAELERARQAHRRAINHMAAEVNDPSFKDVRKKVMFNAIKSKAYYDEDNGMSYFKYDDNGDWTVDESKLDRGAYTKIRHDLEDMALDGTIDVAGRLYLWDVRHRFNETQDSRSQQRRTERDMWADNISYGTPLDDYYADCHRKNKLPSDINRFGIPKAIVKDWGPITTQISDFKDRLMPQENKADDDTAWYTYLSQPIEDIPPKDQEDFRRAVRLQNTLTMVKVSQKYDNIKSYVENLRKIVGVGRFQNEWSEFEKAALALQEDRPLSMMEDDVAFRSGGDGPAEQRFIKAYNTLCNSIQLAEFDSGVYTTPEQAQKGWERAQQNADEKYPTLLPQDIEDIFGPKLETAPIDQEGPEPIGGETGKSEDEVIDESSIVFNSASMLDAEGLTFGELFPIVKSKLGLSDEDTVRFIKHNVENVGAIDDKEAFLKALKKAQEEKQSAPQVPKVQEETTQDQSQGQDPFKDWKPGQVISDEGAKYYMRVRGDRKKTKQRYVPPYLREGHYPPKGNPSPGGEGVPRPKDYFNHDKQRQDTVDALFRGVKSPNSVTLNRNLGKYIGQMMSSKGYNKDSILTDEDKEMLDLINQRFLDLNGYNIYERRLFGEPGKVLRQIYGPNANNAKAQELMEKYGLDEDTGYAARLWVNSGLDKDPRLFSQQYKLSTLYENGVPVKAFKQLDSSDKAKVYRQRRKAFDLVSAKYSSDPKMQNSLNRIWRETIADAAKADSIGEDTEDREFFTKELLTDFKDLIRKVPDDKKDEVEKEIKSIIEDYLTDYRKGGAVPGVYKDSENEVTNLVSEIQSRIGAHIKRMDYKYPMHEGLDNLYKGLDWIGMIQNNHVRPLTLDELMEMPDDRLERYIGQSIDRALGTARRGKDEKAMTPEELVKAMNNIIKGRDELLKANTTSERPDWAGMDPRFIRDKNELDKKLNRLNQIHHAIEDVLTRKGILRTGSAKNSKGRGQAKKQINTEIFSKTLMPSTAWYVKDHLTKGEENGDGLPVEIWRDPSVDFSSFSEDDWKAYKNDQSNWLSNKFILPKFRDYESEKKAGGSGKKTMDEMAELARSVDDDTLRRLKKWFNVMYIRGLCYREYMEDKKEYLKKLENAKLPKEERNPNIPVNHVYYSPDNMREFAPIYARMEMLYDLRSSIAREYERRFSREV